MPIEAAEPVKIRYEFYRDNYRRLVILLLLTILIIMLLVSALIYLITNPPAPKYFAATVNARIMPLVPLNQPNLSESALLQWANTAAIAAYTYNFVNFNKELQAASEYFTSEGWQSFQEALQSSSYLSQIVAKKLTVSAVATGAPVILDQGIINGVYTWKVQMPLLLSYESSSDNATQKITLTMVVTRTSTLNSSRGIGIARFTVATGDNIL